MLRGWIQNYKEKKALKTFYKSALGQSLKKHTDEYFSKYPRLANFSEQGKRENIMYFYQEIFNLMKAKSPLLKMREVLSTHVINFAEMQVVCLTEEEKTETFFSDSDYISGELYHYIDKIFEHIDELYELKWKNPEITNDELIEYCNIKKLLYLYYINGLNLVRAEFNDIDSDKDWFQPFVKAMLIWNEDMIRKKINLDSLLPDKGIDALKYSSFMNLVEEGYKNPYLEWYKEFGKELVL